MPPRGWNHRERDRFRGIDMTIISQNPWIIYALREDTEGSPYRYVGLTTGTANARLGYHKRQSRLTTIKRPVGDWIRSRDEQITIDIIEECPEEDLDFLHSREIFWIEYYRTTQGDLSDKSKPYRILNISAGGKSAYGVVAWNKGKPASETHRENSRIAHLGQTPWIAGKTHTDEAKRVIGQKASKVWKDPEYREAMLKKRALIAASCTWKDNQRKSQMKSQHERNHTKKGIVAEYCAFCTGRYPSSPIGV